jgi:hypothetical protein
LHATENFTYYRDKGSDFRIGHFGLTVNLSGQRFNWLISGKQAATKNFPGYPGGSDSNDISSSAPRLFSFQSPSFQRIVRAQLKHQHQIQGQWTGN